MTEARKLRLSITGTQYPPAGDVAEDAFGDREKSAVVTETEVEAEYYRRGETHYFIYNEQLDGESASLKTRIKYREGLLEMSRQGSMASRMVFHPGVPYRAEYPTPFGKLWIDITTHSVVRKETGDRLKIIVDYSLENEGQPMGIYHLEICGYFTGFAPPFS